MTFKTIIVSLFLAFSVLASQDITAQTIQAETSVPTAPKFPKPIGTVNDFEHVFAPSQIKQLETIIADFEKRTSNEIAIITVNSIAPYDTMAEFATNLSNAWGVGKANQDNGLTIILSRSLREFRISTGEGAEKILTYEICKAIIDNTIFPEFKTGNYYLGILNGLEALIKKWE
ncbi:YgcG family protein [Sediminibacter sp. Hel_I_10]|uniref:TPM domain-containing protein n=1 Tax=Sediminibacter sp. Hel_I_10 TaxID=1392490 RepID=UPI00047CD6C7|nr:TPM domain-containing protein [Sediminibacter sp. Hel_I_10]